MCFINVNMIGSQHAQHL